MMSSAPPKLSKVCTACGAGNPGYRTHCWLCEGGLRVPSPSAPVVSTPYERHAAFQFSFASLMITIALIAVLLGVFRLWPGVGVLLLIIVAPAWIRTCVTVVRRQSQQGTITFGKKASVFATSIAIFVGIGVMVIAAVVGAFAVFCSAMAAAAQSPEYLSVGLVVAAISFGVLTITGLIFWGTRRRSRRGHS